MAAQTPSDGVKFAVVHVLVADKYAASDGVKFAVVHSIALWPAAQTPSDGVKFAVVHSIKAGIVTSSDGVMFSVAHDLSGRQRSTWQLPDKPSSTWKCN